MLEHSINFDTEIPGKTFSDVRTSIKFNVIGTGTANIRKGSGVENISEKAEEIAEIFKP